MKDVNFGQATTNGCHRWANWCWKTTLVNLLMRFYEITDGQILFDGHDITDLPCHDYGIHLAWYYKILGYSKVLLQKILPRQKEATRDEIIQAPKIAQCDHFIRTLPLSSYDTIISSENGSISQGQQQL